MKTFANVAALKLSTLKVGEWVETSGYYTANDGGGARYLVSASGTTYDGYGSHLLANNTVAVIEKKRGLHVKQFGATEDSTDSTAAIQAALDYSYANALGDVYLGNQHSITQINLYPGVTLQGMNVAVPVSGSFLKHWTGPGTVLTQPAGTNKVAVQHLTTDYTGGGLAIGDKGRGIGLQDVLIRSADEAGLGGVLIEQGIFLNVNRVHVIGFDENFTLDDCFDSTLTDIRTTEGDYGISIKNTNDTIADNSNNLIFHHARVESWDKAGIRILSDGHAPRLNNKIEFFHLKNEGGPDANGEAGIIVDAGSEIRFWGGYTSIKGSSTPPTSFNLIDLRADASSLNDIRFENHGLATNAYAGTINSLVKVGSESFAVNDPHLSFSIAVNTGTTLTRGMFDIDISTATPVGITGLSLEIVRLYNPDNHVLTTDYSNIPWNETQWQLATGQFLGRLDLYGDDDVVPSLFLRRDLSGTVYDWEFRIATDQGLRLLYEDVAHVNFVSGGNVNFLQGDVETTEDGKGIIVTSPDGLTRKRIGIDNAGTVQVFNV